MQYFGKTTLTASVLMLSCVYNVQGSLAKVSSIECKTAIVKIIDGISAEKDEDTRIGLSLDLAYYFRDHRNCGSDPRTIDNIAALLSDRDDAVRIGAAMALAYIGVPARRAVPALEKAVKDSDAKLDSDTENTVLPVTTSGGAARAALRKITHKSVPEY